MDFHVAARLSSKIIKNSKLGHIGERRIARFLQNMVSGSTARI
jgi:hypothetical protein